MSGNELPKIVDKSQADIDAAIAAIKSSDMSNATKDFAISCIRLAVWLPKALLEHKIKLSNLRKLIFGFGNRNKKASKKDASHPNAEDSVKNNASDMSNETQINEEDVTAPATTNQLSAPGHGRLPHSAYHNTIEHHVECNLKLGDLCPTQCGGKLYRVEPGILVRVKGQNLAAIHKYWIEKLRCALCGYLVSANIPGESGNEKYDAAFKAILALQKYYVAIPFYRQAYFQSLLGVPLPASTQWQLVEEVGGAALLVFPTLERLAANGDVLHNDDSQVKITDVIRHNRLHPDKERTGTFTTGFISRTKERDIALFYSGRQHAGENMERLLQKRDTSLGVVIQMCDALRRNIPASFQTILCNCLSHGFRKFDDLKDFYPKQCIHVIELIAKIYNCDEKTREMSNLERLQYHQENSQPIMNELHDYLEHQLNQNKLNQMILSENLSNIC